MNTDNRPSNQCDVCGEPATQAALKDPFGKSNEMRPLCGKHGMRIRDPEDVAKIESLTRERREWLDDELRGRVLVKQEEEIERLTRGRDGWKRLNDAHIAESNAIAARLGAERDRLQAALELRNTALRLIKAGPPLRMANDAVASWAAFIASEALSGERPPSETSERQSWPPPPRELTLYGTPDNDIGIDQPECYTAISIGGHMAAILVVTKMADGSPVPPYAQETIDWMLGKSAEKAGEDRAD